MSWLFCCGGSQSQKQKELQATIDLSAPIKNQVGISNGLNNDLDDLAGDFSNKDHQFNEIINKSGNGKKERKEI